MKNIFTVLFVLTSVSVFAYDGGKLTITVPTSKNIQVYIDGRAYQNYDNSIVLNNIQPGNHTITIYKNNRNSYATNGNYGRNQRDRRNNQGDVLYNSNVYVRQSYHVDVMINRFGKALVDERPINRNYRDDDWYDNDNRSRQDNDGSYNNGDYDNRYHQAINDYDFNQLLQKIRSQWIGKMSSARDAVNNNYFSTYQVKQILQIFSSENDRLDLAKLSYKNVVDQQNFRQLYELFSNQSQSDLDRYIKVSRY